MAYRPTPSRRNRNIGTSKQGHGQDNRDTIPKRWLDSRYLWNRQVPHSIVEKNVWGRWMPFMVEHTRSDCVHACTPDDIAAVLNELPKRHINNAHGVTGIQGVVLAQPTRKEQTLRPTWARMGYGVERNGLRGPAIFIEAQSYPNELVWPRSLDPDNQKELSRLEQDADEVLQTKRAHHLRFSLEGVRRVQLYRSLPHEVGHWADMYEKVEVPALEDFEQWVPLWERYFQRPTSERETFAHRYADDARKDMQKSGAIPFDRMLYPEAIQIEGMRLEDFVLGPSVKP